MTHDPQGILPEGRQEPQPEKANGTSPEPQESEGSTEKKAIRFPTNDWDKLTAVALPPCGYALCRTARADGMAFYVWKGDNGSYYSPVFTDKDEAVKWPVLNLFREISPEVLAQQCREQGFAE